jgi:hypothetical protein
LKLRSSRIIVLCLALSLAVVVVAIVAVADHRRSRAQSNRAQLAEWYCDHKGTRCGGPDSARMHGAWENRELGYKVTEGVLAAVFTVGAVGIVLSRRRV